eukprot:TRINITY_DN9595_c0_g1_i1.p1 TRINITY_DN9595_c0_g1~~TRINITY_DN9595_c0_g1_i1.p1  ORF type:complete len:1045 (+),score=258.99 TRINITY_DN9595_c0_g1_i1:42-3137(+)
MGANCFKSQDTKPYAPAISKDRSNSGNEKQVRCFIDETCDVVDAGRASFKWSIMRDEGRSAPQRLRSNLNFESRLPSSTSLVSKGGGSPMGRTNSKSSGCVSIFTQDRFCGPKDNIGHMANALVQRAMRLVDIVGAEYKDVSDHEWAGPPGSEGNVFKWLLNPEGDEPGPLEKGGFSQEQRADAVCALCESAVRILGTQPTLLDVRAPMKIFGDIHGQLRDLLLFFNEFGRPAVGRGGDIEVCSYMFNGDFVDRGEHQVEVVLVLLALKVTYPERIWLIRGNHEDEITNRDMAEVGFQAACVRHFGESGKWVFLKFQTVFNWLPLAAVVESKVMVVHGGIGDGQWNLNYLENVRRPLDPRQIMADKVVHNLLWSDPVPEDANGQDPESMRNATFGVHASKRGCDDVKSFGVDVTHAFCKRNGLDMIVRSHQCTTHGYGYTLMHAGRLMRVFSARHYDNKKCNAAAMLLLGYKRPRTKGVRQCVIRAKVIRPPPSGTENFDVLETISTEEACELVRSASFRNNLNLRKRSFSWETNDDEKLVEVDEQCDVVNKTREQGFGHKKQVWEAVAGAQCLNRKAVVGTPVLCGDRFTGPKDSVGIMSAEIVSRMMELVDAVGTEWDDVSDSDWMGPAECGSDLFAWLMKPMLEQFGSYEAGIQKLGETVTTITKRQPVLVDLRAPVKIFGNLHGQLRDLLIFFYEFGRPAVGQGGDIEMLTYVFDGGWAGKGAHQLELSILLLALKVSYPERIWVLRGAMEAIDEKAQMRRSLLDKCLPCRRPRELHLREACVQRFGGAGANTVMSAFVDVFAYLPFAVTIDARVLVVPSGIGDGNWSLDDLRSAAQAPYNLQALQKDRIRRGLLWSCPNDVGDGTEPFDAMKTRAFCELNQIAMLVRSGEGSACEDGHKLCHNERIMNVSSARRADVKDGNGGCAGAMLVVGFKRPRVRGPRDMVMRAKVVQPPLPPGAPEAQSARLRRLKSSSYPSSESPCCFGFLPWRRTAARPDTNGLDKSPKTSFKNERFRIDSTWDSHSKV